MHLSNSLPLLLSTTALLLTTTQAAYTIKDSYTPSNFFSMFDFFTDSDPTHGYVDYQSQSAAQSANLISTSNNQIYMGVDSTSIGSGRGRKSVRITSKAVYNHALILLDLQHMPGNICGVWPAFWTVGPNWPNNGEIDIIEGVNGQVGNSVALHTGAGCSVSTPSGNSGNTSPNTGSAQRIFSGTIKTANCDVAATNQPTNAGCAITSSDSSTYGDGLNSVNGGVYATEWTSNAISVWFFPRASIPSDITSGNPNPSSWGSPIASFGGGGCTIDNSFRNQQIVFDTTFCGDWAGSIWSTDSMCSGKASTCQDYVMNNPSAFKNAYWSVNSLLVYTQGAGGVVSSSAPASTMSRSVPVPIGSASTTSSATGVPVPPVNSNTNTLSRPATPPAKASSTSTSTSAMMSFTNTYSYGNPTQSAPNVTPTPIMTSSRNVPVAPTPVPTTMSTMSRPPAPSNANANTWTWSWGGNNNNGGGNTWSRGGGGGNWGGPPRVVKKNADAQAKAYGNGNAQPIAGAGADAIPSMPEQGQTDIDVDSAVPFSMGMGMGLGLEQRDAVPVEAGIVRKTLIAPMVRRDVNVNVNVNGETEVRRDDHDHDHLRRHAGHARRHGHEHEHKERRYAAL